MFSYGVSHSGPENVFVLGEYNCFVRRQDEVAANGQWVAKAVLEDLVREERLEVTDAGQAVVKYWPLCYYKIQTTLPGQEPTLTWLMRSHKEYVKAPAYDLCSCAKAPAIQLDYKMFTFKLACGFWVRVIEVLNYHTDIDGTPQVLLLFDNNVPRSAFPPEMAQSMVKECGLMIRNPCELLQMMSLRRLIKKD